MVKQLKARVLLVDDEEEYLKALATRLETRGMEVSTASNGQDAVATIDKAAFDLIILDLAMPGMDGLETLKQIKSRQPEAEIIMLSGQGSIKTSIEAMKLGADDFIEKPVDIKDLLEKISEAKDRRLSLLQSKSIQEIEKILQTKGW
jgi:DNA-binding NtrC family response regulator